MGHSLDSDLALDSAG